MATDVAGAANAPNLARPGSSSTPRRTMEGQKKLPRPIVFWSLNEKTAYRRNRVVQTRMNMIMDDLVNQRETSRRWIRYEAHKFRQRSGKYFSHPSVQSSETQGVNIAPPGWVDKHVKGDKGDNRDKAVKRIDIDDSDEEYDDDENDAVNRVNTLKEKKTGIITEGRRSAVKFAVDNKGKDINKVRREGNAEIDKEQIKTRESYIRSMSALQHREDNDLPNENLKRQKSAFPAFNRDSRNDNGKTKQNAEIVEITPLGACSGDNQPSSPRRSDQYFDRSKAAYELRVDLKRQANLRKQGITTAVFTIRDALRMEREKLTRSREKIVNYIDRVEAIKRAERTVINKWNRGAFEQQLSL